MNEFSLYIITLKILSKVSNLIVTIGGNDNEERSSL